MRPHLGIAHGPVIEAGAWSASLRPACMFGVRAWWSVVLNRSELARRDGLQFGDLQRLAVVDVLLGLPIDESVSERSLSPREVRRLAALPSGVIDRVGAGVVRRASPPLRIDHAVVPARAFRTGLEAASSFSTYCARSMALTTGADATDADLAEASYYGVGVYIADGDRQVELVAPEPMPDWPETPAGWVFSEKLCAQIAPLE
jgi:hypothetical protein